MTRAIPPLLYRARVRPAWTRLLLVMATLAAGPILIGGTSAAVMPKLDLVALLTALLTPPAVVAPKPIAETLPVSAPAPVAPEDDSFLRPLEGEFLSGFGTRSDGMHTGIDLRGATGDPIHASKKGVVMGQACGRGYGTCTMIDHGGGLTTLYAHMSRKLVAAGPVHRGQVIGLIGCTGSCETPHVHFEIRQNGVRMDPFGYL